MKKEENFHVTQLFYAVKDIEGDDTEGDNIEGDNIEGCNTGDADDFFNPHVLFDMSGAANTGIETPHIYGVLRAEEPLSLEDCVQDQGRAGCCLGSDSSSDSCTILVFLNLY